MLFGTMYNTRENQNKITTLIEYLLYWVEQSDKKVTKVTRTDGVIGARAYLLLILQRQAAHMTV